jgi:hypothetical protein
MPREQCFDVCPFKIDPFALRVQNDRLFFCYFHLTIGIVGTQIFDLWVRSWRAVGGLVCSSVFITV